jgi:uncharacterized protein YkwD
MRPALARLLCPALAAAMLLMPGKALAAWQVVTPTAGAQRWYTYPAGHPTGAAAPAPAPTTAPAPPVQGPAPAPAAGLGDGWYRVPVPAGPSPSAAAGAPPAPAAPAPQAPSLPAPPAGVALTAEEQYLVDQTNQARIQAGLNPLTVDPLLTQLARLKSQDMITHNYFGHDSPDLGTPLQMQTAAGIRCAIMGAENIAGARDVQTAFFMFMSSAGHRANILYPGLTRIGVGVVHDGPYGVYVTQEFVGGC